MEPGVPEDAAAWCLGEHTGDCPDLAVKGRLSEMRPRSARSACTPRRTPRHPAELAVEGMKFIVDATDLVGLLRTVTPYKNGRMPSVWTLAKLERAFKQRIGRPGSWRRYNLPF